MDRITQDHLEVAGLSTRLANLRVGNGRALGAETLRGVINVTAAGASLGLPAPSDMDDLLHNGRASEVHAILQALERDDQVAGPIRSPSFAPLVTRPEKIVCVGFNYREHARETNTPVPDAPPLFAKFANSLSGHNAEVSLPTRIARQFDFETELVVVFGRECRDVLEDEALDVVAGYTVGNDLSARDLQMQTSQFTAGKVPDGFAPLGPWLVPATLVPDPNALWLKTTVNGTVRQDWTTSDMVFNCRKLISFVSSIMTMKPGDLLFTGTPQGVILGEKAPREERRWLRAGDEVISEIEKLGALRIKLA